MNFCQCGNKNCCLNNGSCNCQPRPTGIIGPTGATEPYFFAHN